MAPRARAERIIEIVNSAKALGYIALGIAGGVLGGGFLQKPAQTTNNTYFSSLPPQQPSPNIHGTIKVPNGKPQEVTQLVATSPASPGQPTTFRPQTETSIPSSQPEASGTNSAPSIVSLSNPKEGVVNVSQPPSLLPSDPASSAPGDNNGQGSAGGTENQGDFPFGGYDGMPFPGNVDPSQPLPPTQTGEGSWPPLPPGTPPPQPVVVTDPPGAFNQSEPPGSGPMK